MGISMCKYLYLPKGTDNLKDMKYKYLYPQVGFFMHMLHMYQRI